MQVKKENMIISQDVLNKIRVEEKKYPFSEFGGYLLIDKNGVVKDVIFDMSFISGGSVDLGTKQIITLPPKKRKMVNGWFHKHPIDGLSSVDKRTIADLTEFWGLCYTMVLQSNGKMLLMKTTYKESEDEEETEEVNNTDDIINVPKGVTAGSNEKEITLEPRYGWLRKYISNKNKELSPQEEVVHVKTKKKNTFIQSFVYNDVWKNTEVTFEKEIPFGITHFTPQFTNNIQRFKLWYPKLKCMSRELNYIELMSNAYFILSSLNESYQIDKKEVAKLLKLGNIKILMCTGAIDMNKIVLYEGDVVRFITPFTSEELEGTIALCEGKWKVITKKFLHTAEYDLDEHISITLICDKIGRGNT